MVDISHSVPVVQPRMLLGLQTHIKGNIQCLSDDEVAYPVGGVLCIHNISQRKQKFIKLPDKGVNVYSITSSPNKKYLAVAECGIEKPSISIYDPWTCKKKKQLTLPIEKEIQSKELVAVSFTCDSKMLAIVVGEPDWLLLVYKVEKGKLENMARANNSNNTGSIVQIACNPNDPNTLVLVGNQLYRNMGCLENSWRQYGFNKAENLNFTCATWISQDRVVAGTADGKLYFFDSADLKGIFSALDLTVIALKSPEDLQNLPQEQQPAEEESVEEEEEEEEGYEVTRIIPFTKGFLYTCMPGTVHLFEKESAHKYRKKNVFKIPNNEIARGEEDMIDECDGYGNVVFNEVNTIAVTFAEDRFLATCNETQIYNARMWNPDVTGDIPMTEFGFRLHHGPIGNVAVCAWKPLFMTTGTWDRTLRLWNYEQETLELYKKYTEDIYGCDLHPSGLFAVVGFSDKIRFLKILIDDFSCTREYPVRSCKLCKFSNLGHLFAAANSNVIQIYSSINFEHLCNLKGHNGIITGVSWAHDDYKLTSCGKEGAVYEWQIATTRRICETIIKVCKFSDVVLASDGKSNYGVGSDGKLREIINSNIAAEVSINTTGLDSLALANSDNMLFCTGNNGSVYSVLLPLADVAVFTEYVVHATRCKRLQVSYDDKFLISISSGCVCLWKISNAEGRQIKLDKEFSPSTEVMIARSDLLEKMTMIRDLQVRMNELQTEHAYQMRQTEAAHSATIKEIHEGYCAAIEELKEKNENLEQEHNQEISNINVEINKTKTNHEVFVQKLEASYNEKLIVEYDKFMLLEEKLARMRDRYDNQLEELAEAKRISEETITSDFEFQLREKQNQLEDLLERIRQMAKEHETIKQQIEDDADREIYEMKNQFEKELREEQDLNVRLRGETQASKKKLQASQKSIDDLNHTVHMQELEQQKLKMIIFGLEGTIGDLRKEIQERDSTIQDKERRITELKQKNMELEKFKFILEFKIDELKAQIEPRDRTIREQIEQINDMVGELENLQKIIMSLELQLSELREKLKASHNEVKREIVKNRASKAGLKRIKTEIHNASGLTHEIPKLQKAVRDMYHKYNADKDFVVAHAEDTEAKKEFLRQRDFLERTVLALKTQVTKAQCHKSDNLRLVEQNSELIVETNTLRRNLKVERRDNKRMNALLGLNKVVTSYAEGQRKLDAAMATREEIHMDYRSKIEENEKCLHLLKDENIRLHGKLTNKDKDQELELKKRETEIAEIPEKAV